MVQSSTNNTSTLPLWDTSFLGGESSSSSSASSSSLYLAAAPQLRRSNSKPSLDAVVGTVVADMSNLPTPKAQDPLLVAGTEKDSQQQQHIQHDRTTRRRTRSAGAVVSSTTPSSLIMGSDNSKQKSRRGSWSCCATPARFLGWLFLIATYTTLVLPYPQDYVEDASATSSSSSSSAAPSLGDNLPHMALPQQPQQNHHLRGAEQHSSSLQFARRAHHLSKPLTFAARHEFYQQDAVQQQEKMWGWHGAHVSLLLLAAAWVLVVTLCFSGNSNNSNDKKRTKPQRTGTVAGSTEPLVDPLEE